jgi:hypothetical protein
MQRASDTVLSEILGIILGRLRPGDVISILQGDLAPTENLRGPIAAYLRHHAGIEAGAEVSEEQLWGLKEEIVGAVASSMDDSSLPAEITSKLNPGAGLTPAGSLPCLSVSLVSAPSADLHVSICLGCSRGSLQRAHSQAPEPHPRSCRPVACHAASLCHWPP